MLRRIALALVLLPTAAAASPESECAAEGRALAREVHDKRLYSEVSRLQAAASTSWAGLRPAAVACLEQTDRARRRACAAPVDAFVARSRALVARLPAGAEVVPTTCGTRSVSLPAESLRVEVESMGEARALSRSLRSAADGSVVASTAAPEHAPEARAPAAPPDPLELQRRMAPARLESITRLKELMAMAPVEGDILAEMTLRLADLYLEEGRYQRLAEDRRCGETPGCVSADRASSSPWTTQSVALYRSILERFPQFMRADEAMFYMGAALIDLGQTVEGNAALTALVKNYPESRYIPDAYVAIGDYWYATSNPAKSLMAYARAASYRHSEKYAYALYKLAWCHENVGEHAQAMETMAKAVEAAREGGKAPLEAQAAKDLATIVAAAR